MKYSFWAEDYVSKKLNKLGLFHLLLLHFHAFLFPDYKQGVRTYRDS